MPNNVFPYPGNKARHSEWILNHFPQHQVYVELFGGAAGVLFNKPQSKIEVYNDLNGDIPHFFKVLRDRGDELQEWLRNVPHSREVHQKWANNYYGGDRQNDDIKRAGRFFALRYFQYGGVVGKKAGFHTNSSPQAAPVANKFHNKVEALNEFRDRLRGVTIENLDWPVVVEKYDEKYTLFYADPPYEGTEGRYNAQGFNHAKLARKAKEIEGKIAISYDSIPPMYGDGFNVVSKDSHFALNKSGGPKDVDEILIMNYDSKGEPLMSDVGQQTLDAISD